MSLTRTFVVTGGTAGIGLHTAIGLAKSGGCVVVVGRDAEKGAESIKRIQDEASNPDVHLMTADLSRMREVLALAVALRARHTRVDALVNNAGVCAAEMQTTEDGFELDFAVNVAAPYVLVQALLPVLEAAPGARVVNVTGGNARGALDPTNMEAERGFLGLTTYDNSKRALEAMSVHLAARIAPRGVDLNLVYPGQASTAMTRGLPRSAAPPLLRVAWPLFRWAIRDDGGKGAARASRSSVWAATAPELRGVHGQRYDQDCRPAPMHASVLSPEHQARVITMIERGLRDSGHLRAKASP